MTRPEELTPVQLVEEACRLVAESSAVQRARAACFTEGALLAVEQVQDVRIANVEFPEQESGWTMWAGLAMTFLIDSNIATKMLKTVARVVYTSLTRANAVWLLTPKAPTGRQLAAIARRPLKGPPIEPLSVRLLGKNVLDQDAGGLTDPVTKDSIRVYHSVIAELAHHTSGLDFTKGTVKTVREMAQQAGGSEPKVVSVGLPPSYLSVGVEMLSSAQDYARATILGIDIRAARIDTLLRTQVSARDIAVICEAFEQPDMRTAAADPNVTLVAIRTQCASLFEALIWARLFGFRLEHPHNIPGRGYPAWRSSAGGYETLDFDQRALLDYWMNRFGKVIDEWVISKGMASFYAQGVPARLMYLRGYFATVAHDFEGAAGELARLVGPVKQDRRP